jgi:hypothetical protein
MRSSMDLWRCSMVGFGGSGGTTKAELAEAPAPPRAEELADPDDPADPEAELPPLPEEVPVAVPEAAPEAAATFFLVAIFELDGLDVGIGCRNARETRLRHLGTGVPSGVTRGHTFDGAGFSSSENRLVPSRLVPTNTPTIEGSSGPLLTPRHHSTPIVADRRRSMPFCAVPCRRQQFLEQKSGSPLAPMLLFPREFLSAELPKS